jgi:hypothetical protein
MATYVNQLGHRPPWLTSDRVEEDMQVAQQLNKKVVETLNLVEQKCNIPIPHRITSATRLPEGAFVRVTVSVPVENGELIEVPGELPKSTTVGRYQAFAGCSTLAGYEELLLLQKAYNGLFLFPWVEVY